eukprot:jgi/Galph1/249/GphlegSOOS_G4991.1
MSCNITFLLKSFQRSLYESILNRVVGHLPCLANGFKSWTKTEKMADFIRNLNNISQDETIYLVLLHIDALISFCPKILPVLLELDKYLFNIRIHISCTSYLSWEHMTENILSFHEVSTPFLVWFPNYQMDEFAILLETRLKTDPKFEKLKKPFVRIILDVLYHATPYLEQLTVICEELFSMYIKPIENGIVSLEDTTKLYSNILPHLKSRLNGLYCLQQDSSTVMESKDTAIARVQRNDVFSSWSTTAKLLCIAGYMASRIPSKRDMQIFTKTFLSKKRRHSSKKPRTTSNCSNIFSLERILAIYRHLQQQLEDVSTADYDSGLVLIEWKTLCDCNFITAVRSDKLTNPKYQSQITDEVFRTFSKGFGLQLEPYFG